MPSRLLPFLLLLACSAPKASADPSCREVRTPKIGGRIQDNGLKEISGVAMAQDGRVWVLQDSGNAAELRGLEEHGVGVKVLALDGARNVDWEELQVGPCHPPSDAPMSRCFYVGDIGDNDAKRDTVQIYRVPEPMGTGRVKPAVLSFRYPEGPRDAEAFVVLPSGRIQVFSKRDVKTDVFELEPLFDAPEPQVATHRQTLATDADDVLDHAAWVTGAALTEDGDRLFLRTYGAIWAFDGDGKGVWRAESRARLPSPTEEQGEAILWDLKGGYWTIGEGKHEPIWRAECK